MAIKLPCGCTHNDTHWLQRCAACAAWDAETSARWANDRANPPAVRMHRINGVVQSVIQPNYVETASPEVMKAMIPVLLPEPVVETNEFNDLFTNL
jgi:hypothetical protein